MNIVKGEANTRKLANESDEAEKNFQGPSGDFRLTICISNGKFFSFVKFFISLRVFVSSYPLRFFMESSDEVRKEFFPIRMSRWNISCDLSLMTIIVGSGKSRVWDFRSLFESNCDWVNTTSTDYKGRRRELRVNCRKSVFSAQNKAREFYTWLTKCFDVLGSYVRIFVMWLKSSTSSIWNWIKELSSTLINWIYRRVEQSNWI